MMNMNPLLICDTYKTTHERMYNKDLIKLTSYLTPRKSMIESQKKVVFFGLQAVLKEMKQMFDTNFFNKPLAELEDSYKRYMNIQLGQGNYEWSRVERLHKLGYLPLEVKALPEGSYVDMGVPVVEITNTHDDFAWLTQWTECWLQGEIWKTCNHATIGHMYYKLFKKWYSKNTDGADPHMAASDFGMRGMSCMNEAEKCSASWLLSFNKTSTIPALPWLDTYYDADCSFNHIGLGAVSTEHSVMASNFAIDGDEISFLKRMLTELYPETSFSVVSDTYDYWNLVKVLLPKLRAEIMDHNGKMLIRPDSGDQVTTVVDTVQALWDTFGGTENKLGYKVLDPHIGVILGDGCSLKVVDKILKILDERKFAANNVAFGIGAFCFSAIFDNDKMIVNTRDVFGFAMKATYGVVRGPKNFGNKPIEIFKDPKTDTDNLKKSHRGLCVVSQDAESKEYYVKDGFLDDTHKELYCIELTNESGVSMRTWNFPMQTVFKDGVFMNTQNLMEIRNRLEKEDA